jgi:D-xylose transport system permease protein
MWAGAPAPTSPVAPVVAEGDETALQLAPGTTDVPPELVESFPEYLRAWWRRVRGGDSGALPIIAGLILIVVIFQVQQSKFLSSGNLVNLLVQAAVFVMLGLAETFALLLSEIDLSIGYVAAVCGFIVAELMAAPYNWPWWGAVVVGLLAAAAIGALQGTLITRLRLPAFVVTLAGLLGWQGVMIFLADIDKTAVGGVITIPTTNVIYELVNTNVNATVSWFALLAVLVLYAVYLLGRDARRRRSGLTAPPLSVTIATIGVVAVAGIALVWVCNRNRGALTPLRGVPWVIPFILVVLVIWSVLLGRTKLGRYIYAIGANPEAVRRAGVNVALVRTAAFMLCSFTAGIAGIVYESRLGSMATDIDGGTLVLYAVAAAVIGGTSLFGGKGKAVYALLGGLVIAAVYNGLGLLGVSAAGQDIATALVLLAAVTVDSLVRRRGTQAGA